MSGIIYLIQPCELKNTNRFKIGCSNKPNLERCNNGYKKGSRYLVIMECNKPLFIENKIKELFNEKYKLIAGKEYFEINVDEKIMIQDFVNIVLEYNFENDVEEVKFDDKNKINYMKYLKDYDLEKYIRIKLGEDFENPKFINFKNNKIINKYELIKLNKEEQRDYRKYHKRIKFNAQNCNNCSKYCNCNDDIYENNKNICDIFSDDLNSFKIVLYIWKGGGYSYLINKNDYNEYNYWDNYYYIKGVNGDLDLPYLYKEDLTGETTVNIIKSLIKQSNILRRYEYNRKSCNNVILDYFKEMKRNK